MAEIEDTTKIVQELIIAAADTAIKWVRWKQTHDVNSMSMKCCEHSINFFDSLEHQLDALKRAGVILPNKEGDMDG